MKEQEAYGGMAKRELILRDYLAAERTVLANERTFLAYIRTALSLLVTGAFFAKFLTHVALQGLGWALIPAGIAVFIIGLARYRTASREVERLMRAAGEEDVRP